MPSYQEEQVTSENHDKSMRVKREIQESKRKSQEYWNKVRSQSKNK